MNILHRRNLGFLYDVCNVIICKTAKRETWIDLFVRNGSESGDLQSIEQILARIDDVDPSLVLFGHRDRKKGSLIGDIFVEFVEDEAKQWEVEDFVQYLMNIERSKEFISKYYLGCYAGDETLKMIASAQDIKAEIKSLLYEFFLFPNEYMEKVADAIRNVADKLQKFYSENLDKLLECQEKFDFKLMDKENGPFAKKRRWNQGMKNCFVSFALASKYALLRGRNGEDGWVILGYEYRKSFNETVEKQVDVAAFGNAFGDKLRVKIVEEIVNNGEMTLADLSKKLGVVNTIAIYHLDILKKENLLLHRYSGRKVLYCLNTSQINKGLAAIKKLCGEDEE